MVLQPGAHGVVDRVPEHVQDLGCVKPLGVHAVDVQKQIHVVELRDSMAAGIAAGPKQPHERRHIGAAI